MLHIASTNFVRMQSLSIYKILTYILLPFGALLGFNAVSSIVFSLSNPLLLIMSVIIACLPLYIFTSAYFLFNSVKKEQPCKASLKEWIKANAVVSVLFAVLMLLSSLSFLMLSKNPQFLSQALQQMPANQKAAMGNISTAQLVKLFNVFIAIMLPFSIILIVHIVLTFAVVKKYQYLFSK